MIEPIPTDETALSPVVGILLLLSLTVLLGATAATFAVGLSDEPTESPSAAFSFDADRASGSSDTVSIKHRAGETIEADNLYVVVEGVTCSGSDDPNGEYNVDDDFEMGPDVMSSGMSIRYGRDIDIDGTTEVCSGGDLSVEGATFTIVWRSSGGGVELQTWAV